MATASEITNLVDKILSLADQGKQEYTLPYLDKLIDEYGVTDSRFVEMRVRVRNLIEILEKKYGYEAVNKKLRPIYEELRRGKGGS